MKHKNTHSVKKKGEQSLHKISKPVIRKKSAEGKTPRGIITSYGKYSLVEIDFKRITPNNGHLRVSGVFDHIPDSPSSPVPSVSGSCWERPELKETDSLVETSYSQPIETLQCETSVKNTKDVTTSIGIDVTTKELFLITKAFQISTQIQVQYRYTELQVSQRGSLHLHLEMELFHLSHTQPVTLIV